MENSNRDPVVSGHLLPAHEGEAALGSQSPGHVGEPGDRVGEEHHPEPAEGMIEGTALEGVGPGITPFEPNVADPAPAWTAFVPWFLHNDL
jgi:hypothetical protein